MKRTYRVGFLLITVIMGTLLFGCKEAKPKDEMVSLSEEDFQTIERINKCSNLGFEFFETLGKDSRGMISVSSEDTFVRGTGYAYQNIEDDVKLAELQISGGDYNLFGIRIGDSVDDAERVMGEYGFSLNSETVLRTETARVTFDCGNIYVNFEYNRGADEKKINRINLIAYFTPQYDLNLGVE